MNTPDGPRFAIYYAPDTDDPLALAGVSWLGRDAETNARMPQPDHPGIAEVTAEARKYGFHATLKPPMRLAAGRSSFALRDAAASLARALAPFELPPLAVANVGNFLALCDRTNAPALRHLADRAVEALDGFRAQPGEAELTRRRAAGLTAVQEDMLTRWGYPYVFGEWTFHMTLTRRLGPAEKAVWKSRAELHFADALNAPRTVRSICVFAQASLRSPFTIAERFPFGT